MQTQQAQLAEARDQWLAAKKALDTARIEEAKKVALAKKAAEAAWIAWKRAEANIQK